MKKLEFIKELRSRLKGYPKDVVDNAVNYYSECIDDAVEDGRNEEEAVRALGSMDEIVRNTLKDVPLSKLVKNKVKPDHRLNAFEIIILIIRTYVPWCRLALHRHRYGAYRLLAASC